MYITRYGDKGKDVGEYTEVMPSQDLVKFRYNEWMQLLELINKQKGKYVEELRLILERLITKANDLDLVPKTSDKPSSSSTSASLSRKKTFKGVTFLLPYGTKFIDNSLPVGVHPLQHMFIIQPKHDILYMDESKRMCFQCSSDLAKAPTEHLVRLKTVSLVFAKLSQNYHFLISMELNNRNEELGISDYF